MKLGLGNSLVRDSGQSINYALNLNGTNQYLSKSSPSKLDLNGVSMLDNATDGTMEAETTTWTQPGGETPTGNHVVLGTSTEQYKYGSKSLKTQSTGAGDNSANYFGLPADSWGTVVAGNKYTVEFWIRANTAGTTVTCYIGTGQYKTSAALVAETWTKFTFNFLATSNEVGKAVRLYYNQADIAYIDGFEIAQKYDLVICATVKPTNPMVNDYPYILTTGFESQTNGYAVTYNKSSGKLQVGLSTKTAAADGDYLSLPSTSAIAQRYNKHTVMSIINATGTMRGYVDNVAVTADTDISTYGICRNSSDLFIGQKHSGTQKWSGLIALMQIIRFDNILLSNFVATTHKNGTTPTGGGAEVVASYDWKGDSTTFDDDKTGTGNNLTGTNITIADRVRI